MSEFTTLICRFFTIESKRFQRVKIIFLSYIIKNSLFLYYLPFIHKIISSLLHASFYTVALNIISLSFFSLFLVLYFFLSSFILPLLLNSNFASILIGFQTYRVYYIPSIPVYFLFLNIFTFSFRRKKPNRKE